MRILFKSIAVHGIAVELLDKNNKRLKKYYVGGMTQDERGTYFLMDQSNQPYVLELPGFMGNLRERFKPSLGRWRSQKFLNIDPSDITKVQGNYPSQPKNSFEYEIGDKTYNPQRMDAYLFSLNKIACESYLNTSPLKDSIMATTPFCELKIDRKNDQPIELQFWTKSKNEQADQIGARYYVRKDEEFMVAQFQVIKAAFRSKSFFND